MLFEYEGLNGRSTYCGLDLILDNIAIVIELKDNNGTSVTNAIERIANKICEEFDIDKKRLILLETYEGKEEIDLVRFNKIVDNKLIGPVWKHINNVEDIKEILKEESWRMNFVGDVDNVAEYIFAYKR